MMFRGDGESQSSKSIFEVLSEETSRLLIGMCRLRCLVACNADEIEFVELKDEPV
jgi:hypothetical protein